MKLWTFGLLLFLVVFLFLNAEKWKSGDKAKNQTLVEKIRKGAIVVDVRTPMEYQTGHYPGAINIPLDQLPMRLGQLDRKKEIIVYCASGVRSAQAKIFLEEKGFKVTNAGGLRDMPR